MAVRRATRLAFLAAATAATVAMTLPGAAGAPSPKADSKVVPPTCASRGGVYAARNGRVAMAPAWEAAGASSPGWERSPAPQSASFAITAPALTWRPTSSISEPHAKAGAEGVIKLPFSVDVAGNYRVLLHSSSGGITDGNDVWFALPWPRVSSAFVRDRGNEDDRSLKLISTAADGGYVKMYQNVGPGKWTWESNVVDENDHILITRWLVPGRTYVARLAARSPVFSVDRVVLYRCDAKLEGEGSCDDSTGTWKRAVEEPDSRCIVPARNASADKVNA